jgi:hypothetical protein
LIGQDRHDSHLSANEAAIDDATKQMCPSADEETGSAMFPALPYSEPAPPRVPGNADGKKRRKAGCR